MHPRSRRSDIEINKLSPLCGIGIRDLGGIGAGRANLAGNSGFKTPRPGGCVRLCGSVYHIARAAEIPGSPRHVFFEDGWESGLIESSVAQKVTQEDLDRLLGVLFRPNVLFRGVLQMREYGKIHGVEHCEMKVLENSMGGGVRVIFPKTANRYESNEKGVIFSYRSRFGAGSTDGVFVPLKSAIVEPLQYPLLFPRGEAGWYFGMKNVKGRNASLNWYVRRVMFNERKTHSTFAPGWRKCGYVINIQDKSI